MSYYRMVLASQAGAKARRDGKPTSANDREPFTIYYDSWWDGWNAEENRIYAMSPEEILAELDGPRRKAMLTRDGQGEYNSTTLRKLKGYYLVDDSFVFTGTGLAVRKLLGEPS